MSLPPIPLPSDPVNLAVIHGTLSSDPVTRELPSCDLVHNYEVTVRSADGPADTVPVARFTNGRVPTLQSGDTVIVTGRVRRRFFRAGGVTASRTEILADAIVPSAKAAAAKKALGRALSPLLGDPSATTVGP